VKVLLDACVLYPTVMREILLGCATAGLFTPLWSARILEEWARATAKLGPGAEAVARGEVALLRARWPGAEVAARDGDLRRLVLPDTDDVHVLAAAVAGSADVLCTLNARDFPRGVLSAEGVERLDPDQLLLRLHDVAPAAVAAAVAAVHAEAERLSGEALALRSLMKRARLPRLAKRLT
jgi:hypothetical protein